MTGAESNVNRKKPKRSLTKMRRESKQRMKKNYGISARDIVEAENEKIQKIPESMKNLF